MSVKKTLVITSIASPTLPVLHTFANDCHARGIDFILIGDTKSPEVFDIPHCDYWSVSRQLTLNSKLAPITPTRHYSRKNLGYLIAMERGTTELVETDDDNFPREAFWYEKTRTVKAHDIQNQGWLNVYKHFSDAFIWPRGLPLERLQDKLEPLDSFPIKDIDCPIQQGLADENPDVDAVYRLTYPLPIDFKKGMNVALGKNTWCPFNSQNTYWYIDAFPLLYLPSYCSFRMTDIWRSFVAQRIAWENGWSILFHESTVWQERNEHNLLRDFEDEIPGYLNNAKIAHELGLLELKPGKENLLANLVICYDTLCDKGFVGMEEKQLVRAWAEDVAKVWG